MAPEAAREIRITSSPFLLERAREIKHNTEQYKYLIESTATTPWDHMLAIHTKVTVI